MSGPQHHTTQWRLMKILHDANGFLDVKELASRVELAPATVRGALIRPARARWVTVTPVTGPNHSTKYLYLITNLGRQVLADHLKEKESS